FCGTSGRLRDAQNWFLGTSVLRHDCLRYHRRLYGSPLVEAGRCPHDCCGGTTRARRAPQGRGQEGGGREGRIGTRVAVARGRKRLRGRIAEEARVAEEAALSAALAQASTAEETRPRK